MAQDLCVSKYATIRYACSRLQNTRDSIIEICLDSGLKASGRLTVHSKSVTGCHRANIGKNGENIPVLSVCKNEKNIQLFCVCKKRTLLWKILMYCNY